MIEPARPRRGPRSAVPRSATRWRRGRARPSAASRSPGSSAGRRTCRCRRTSRGPRRPAAPSRSRKRRSASPSAPSPSPGSCGQARPRSRAAPPASRCRGRARQRPGMPSSACRRRSGSYRPSACSRSAPRARRVPSPPCWPRPGHPSPSRGRSGRTARSLHPSTVGSARGHLRVPRNLRSRDRHARPGHGARDPELAAGRAAGRRLHRARRLDRTGRVGAGDERRARRPDRRLRAWRS